ncbi:hypothetical protein COU76_01690 [Candidatus Peregrinibacteria bacterium CG10_big_fil_rev_8_21_14_0_10_49_10]|nr:MAG: hypothetical protein COU76_01690 [Candidatus Peregrinibacteria bacterium CG10_big_fil_rev_8_21_14_0_10_49_10]
MSVQAGAHWLAFLWSLQPGEGAKLTKAVRKAKRAGATVFEIMPPLLNGMPAEETAKALKNGGITHAVMCNFYPKGAGIGDPLAEGKEFDLAVKTFREVIAYILELRKHGITIDLIVGPSCFLLGHDYGLSKLELRNRAVQFYGQFTEELRQHGIRVAVELLRAVEDKVIESVTGALAILRMLPEDVFGFHFDTFHFRDRGHRIVGSILRLKGRIFHFHANGKDRVPPGHDLDDIEWEGEDGVVSALELAGFVNGVATNEPFCDDVRKAEPSLGEGLPPAMPEPAGLKMTVDNLKRFGLVAH